MINFKNQNSCSDDQVPFTIRIGVTGHRILHDEKKLEAAVRKCLDKCIFDILDKETQSIIIDPAHTGICFSVITPLAEGADRMVAREVLCYPGATIEAVLPLTIGDYIEDFVDENSVEEFQQLLDLSHRSVFLRRKNISDQSDDEAQRALIRQRAYEDVGRYTVDHCDVLIALWDGMPAQGKGGTAEIIDYAKSVQCPVIKISTNEPFDISIIPGRKIRAEVLRSIEKFNSYKITEKEKQEYAANVCNDLFGGELANPLLAEAKEAVKKNLIPVYVRSSLIAKHHQAIYRRSGFLVYFFSALSVAAVALGILVHSLSFAAYLTELLLLLAIIMIVFHAKKKESHRLWYESRFLSERLRSAFFFAACSLQPERIAMPVYLQQAWKQDWMLSAYEAICRRLPGRNDNPVSQCAHVEFIREKLLKEQITYHSQKAESLSRKNQRMETVALALFGVAIASAATHLLLHYVHGTWVHDFENVLTFLAVSLPAFGAAVGGIKAHRDYGRMTMQSRNQADALRIIEQRFVRCRDVDELEKFLHEMDEIMLEETQDWLNLVRFLKLEAAA